MLIPYIFVHKCRAPSHRKASLVGQPQELELVLILNPQTCCYLLFPLSHRLPRPQILVSQVQHRIVRHTLNLPTRPTSMCRLLHPFPIWSLYPQVHPPVTLLMRLHLQFTLFVPILSTPIVKSTDLSFWNVFWQVYRSFLNKSLISEEAQKHLKSFNVTEEEFTQLVVDRELADRR